MVAATDTMVPRSTWHNGGYFGHVSDCNAYLVPKPLGGAGFGPTLDFELRVLVAKVRETFEIVRPPDLP